MRAAGVPAVGVRPRMRPCEAEPYDIILSVLEDVCPNGDGLAIVLKCYLDLAERHDAGGIVTVAGAVFYPDKFKDFSRSWNKMLRRLGVQSFHATDFYTRGGDFAGIDASLLDNASRVIPRLLNQNIAVMSVVAFRREEYDALPIPWKNRFGSPYGVAAQLVVGAIGHWANEVNAHGPFAYFIETGDDEQSDVDRAFKGIAKKSHLRGHASVVHLK